MPDILYIVVPCYNEEAVLPETAKRLREKLGALVDGGVVGSESRIMLVDDGSKDGTWAMIESLCEQDRRVAGVKLSRNRGHQNALLAGLMTARESADVVISMDADLQDDIDAVDRMLHEYDDGCDIVYGVRSERKTDTAFKRMSAQGYYKLLAAMGVRIVYNHADYRLMSRRALDMLSEFKEVNLFLRGIIPLIGLKSASVAYARAERFAGESKYPLRKMLAFAFDGITSFSIRPIRVISTLGFLIFVLSLCFTIYTFVVKFFGLTVAGWSALMASIWMLGGLQLLSLGIIGEYIGKIYNESKARPRYIIDKVMHNDE